MRTQVVIPLLLALVALSPFAAAEEGAISDAERTKLSSLAKMLFVSESELDFSDPASVARFEGAKGAEHDLLSLLGNRRAAWDHVRPTLLALPRAKEKRDVKARLLTVLARDPDPRTLGVIGAELEKDEELLETSALIHLDGRGLAPAGRILVDRVKRSPDQMSSVYPAAHLAMGGDAVGHDLLASVAKKTHMLETMPDTWLAACAALGCLGEDAWKKALAACRARIEASLDKGQVRYAAWLLLRVEYFHRAGARKERVSLAFMSTPVAEYEAKHGKDLDTAGKVRARLAKL